MILNMSGGASVLNYKVVGGTTAPSNPKENTIWVNTPNKITGHYFQSTQPANMAEGEVWVITGIASSIEFNVLKNNSVKVYPVSAKQYISGSLVDKTATIYQNGTWREWWDGSILVGANQYESVTGGWQTAEGIGTAVAINATGINFTRFNTDNDGTSWAYAITNKKIDLTQFNTLSFDCKVASDGYGTEIGVSMTTPGTGTLTVKIVPPASSDVQKLTLDVSSVNGEAYIVARSKKHVASYNNIKLYFAEQSLVMGSTQEIPLVGSHVEVIA